MWDRFILICSTTSISRSTDCPLILLTPVALQENGNLLKPARKHGSLVDTHAENTRESCTPHTFAKSSLPFWSKSSTGTLKRRMVRRIAAPLKRKAKEKPAIQRELRRESVLDGLRGQTDFGLLLWQSVSILIKSVGKTINTTTKRASRNSLFPASVCAVKYHR